MVSFSDAEIFRNTKQDLLNQYEKIMILKIYIDNSRDLKRKYLDESMTHNLKLIHHKNYIDAGFDLYIPRDTSFQCTEINKVDLNIKCSAKICTNDKEYNTGYYIYPRSSISKTPLRLANSIGIIDAGYRGNLITMFDMIYLLEYEAKRFDRHVQICAPGLIPILVEIVDDILELGETERGDGGFGSTGR